MKGGSYAEQRRGGIALLMMIMPSVSITFSNYFSGILFTLLRQVTFAEEAEAELETEGEVAALRVDVDHLAGVVFLIVHAFAATGDTVFQFDFWGDHCVVCVLSVGGNRIVRPVSSTFRRKIFKNGCKNPLRKAIDFRRGSVYNDLDGILAVLAAPSSRSVAKLTAKGEFLYSSMISALIF